MVRLGNTTPTSMEIASAVRDVQSPEASVRENAELKIRQAGTLQPHHVLNQLFEFARHGAGQLADAQTSMLLIKNLVVSYWSAAFQQFTGPAWDPNIKNLVRSELLNTVADPTTPDPIRDAAESVIARIGSLEYPDEWPDLVRKSIDLMMNDQNLNAGLTLFRELLSDTVREQDFWDYGGQLLGRLFNVISDYGGKTRLYSLQCFHECINFFLMGQDDSQLAQLETLAGAHLDRWNKLFAKLIVEETDDDIQHELIMTLHDLESAFDDLMKSDMPMLFEAMFTKLSSYGSSKEDHQEILALQVDFLDLSLRASPSVLQKMRDDHSVLHKLLELCVELATAPLALQEQWIDDFNEFVTHEVELSTEAWPRPSVGCFIGTLTTPTTLASLVELAATAQSWELCESALFLVSCALSALSIESQKDYNLESLLHVVDRSFEGPELLLARAILAAGTIVKYLFKKLDADKRSELLFKALPLLESTNSNIIKCACLKTVGVGCSLFPAEFRSRQETLLASISSVIPEAENDTPSFLVGVFLEVLRLDFDAAIHYNEVFGMFFALVAKDTSNVELNAEILDMVGEFMVSTHDDVESQRLVFNQLLTPVLHILVTAQQNKFEYSSDLQFALDICTTVFERCSKGVIATDMTQLLTMFGQLVETCEDSQIVQAASFAYTALIERSSNVTEENIQNMLEVASKLLDPSLDDTAALSSGRLVTALIDNFGDKLGNVLGDLFIATSRRFLTATHVLLIESLSLSISSVIQRDAHSAVDLLVQNDLQEPVLTKWVLTFELVQGADDIYGYIVSLQALFNLHDPRVDSILVNDEPVASDRPVTRSKGLKFTQIRLPLKIIKLLIHELDQSPPPLQNSADDDGWTDEVVIGLDGGEIDGRKFGLIMDWFKKVGEQNLAWYSQLNEQERQILRNNAQY